MGERGGHNIRRSAVLQVLGNEGLTCNLAAPR